MTSTRRLIECVPNFSEGVNVTIIQSIADEIRNSSGVQLLDIDPGKGTNRTVVTFVGDPDSVIDAAFLAIKKASELIDMRNHKGEHPRMGATDVCPLIPISGITMEETVVYAHKLAERVGEELGIPVFTYEEAASSPSRRNLASIRGGEYEGMANKLLLPDWKPDYGPSVMPAKHGVTAIGARDFLIAYNVNLNTTSVRRANSVAFDIREKGRIKREDDKIDGAVIKTADGEPERIPGMCPGVKAIGWYIPEYGVAQISMNITDIRKTKLHEAFEACHKSAESRGLRVTGSELVGLVPKQVMLDAGKYFLAKQQRSIGVSEDELIKIAIKSMGLDELAPFDPSKKIIEYLIDIEGTNLVAMSLKKFAQETSSESPAPGGGSVAAYVGSLGASLGAMVANLSSHKRGWDDKWEYFSDLAVRGQYFKDVLLAKVDEDTEAFNQIINAIRMPKSSDVEKQARLDSINAATRNAIEVPASVMRICYESYDLLDELAEQGNPASISDIGVGVACMDTAIIGAGLNVKINCKDFGDKAYVKTILAETKDLITKSATRKKAILAKVEGVIGV
jgi:glutamate formiminotransferase / formiminotetrahydrofolate cyclodeaminase